MKSTYANETAEDTKTTLNNILDIISDGVWDWNVVTGKVIRSPGWYRMLGFSIDCFGEDVYTWENIIHPDDYDGVMKHFEAYVTGKNTDVLAKPQYTSPAPADAHSPVPLVAAEELINVSI